MTIWWREAFPAATHSPLTSSAAASVAERERENGAVWEPYLADHGLSACVLAAPGMELGYTAPATPRYQCRLPLLASSPSGVPPQIVPPPTDAPPRFLPPPTAALLGTPSTERGRVGEQQGG
jgi:hypothetical protein